MHYKYFHYLKELNDYNSLFFFNKYVQSSICEDKNFWKNRYH